MSDLEGMMASFDDDDLGVIYDEKQSEPVFEQNPLSELDTEVAALEDDSSKEQKLPLLHALLVQKLLSKSATPKPKTV